MRERHSVNCRRKKSCRSFVAAHYVLRFTEAQWAAWPRKTTMEGSLALGGGGRGPRDFSALEAYIVRLKKLYPSLDYWSKKGPHKMWGENITTSIYF